MLSRSDGSHRRLGASSIEYALLVALIAFSMLVTMSLVGDRLSALFTIGLPGSPLGNMQAL
ncbi:MAG: Flp family type IVb pilin, partial [Proteobacteria bacterium]|nr:Flp family type IVb pilin [Pseudomonadota bacterium]